MRFNLKKVLAVAFLFAILWFLISYLFVTDMPSPSGGSKALIQDIEERLEQLQQNVKSELEDSKDLLLEVQQHLKKKPDVIDNQVYNYIEQSDKKKPVLPVLVIACDRVTVKRCLDNLVRYRPDKETFPIIVSQDCGHNITYKTIKKFITSHGGDKDNSIRVVRQPDLSEIVIPKQKVKFSGYYKIARHFKFALGHVLDELGHEAVIIIEDDLDISPDLFEYFLGTYPLLKKDPSLWCISAWNDNGKRGLIDTSHPELLYRTDFFPGLGWLLARDTWNELRDKWPDAFFDDWLRNPANTGGRACIRPELSRTYSFGKIGVSKGLFFENHLKHIQLNDQFVQFTKLNLTYLIKNIYDPLFADSVYSLPIARASEASNSDLQSAVRVPYSDSKGFRKAAKMLGLMDDFRSGVPRTAYRGVVTCYISGHRVYLAPELPWRGYDPAWG